MNSLHEIYGKRSDQSRHDTIKVHEYKNEQGNSSTTSCSNHDKDDVELHRVTVDEHKE